MKYLKKKRVTIVDLGIVGTNAFRSVINHDNDSSLRNDIDVRML